MTWRVFVRPEAEDDVVEAAAWYERRSEGLGLRFSEEVIAVFDALAEILCYIAAAIPARAFIGNILSTFHIGSSTKSLKRRGLS